MMKNKIRHFVQPQSGFSLVEIMVGMVIGLLATLVIVQIMSAFENQKRVTTGTADAQTSGNIALFNIERELQMSGYPLIPAAVSPLKCSSLTINGTLDTSTAKRISPIVIVDGGPTGTDSITLRYGSTLSGGIPTKVTAVVGSDATVVSSFGCAQNDVTLAYDSTGTNCAMSRVSNAIVPGGTTITLDDTTAVTPGSNLSCLGAWNEVTFAVINGNLTRNGVPVVTGIVGLQAQYGVTANTNTNTIVNWIDASGATWGDTNLNVNNRNTIRAVRLAVIARNPKMEPNNVTQQCSSETAPTPTGLCAWDGSAFAAPKIDLSATDPSWLRYRYRVFETTIPLRNMIWSKGSL